MSDVNRVKATNQFALPVLTYPMWTQHWEKFWKHWDPLLAEPQSIDRETRKLTSENDENPLRSTAVLFLPRDKGGRGQRSVEQEYKFQ